MKEIYFTEKLWYDNLSNQQRGIGLIVVNITIPGRAPGQRPAPKGRAWNLPILL